MLFEKQYILTEDVVRETRYRTETRTGTRLVYDEDLDEYVEEEYEYELQVPYYYYICTVTLENFNLSHLPIYIMGEEKLSRYALYMATLGNRTDLFPTSSYVGKYTSEPFLYEVPEEYLANETFAAIYEEAQKYIGYPYVWGGYKPSTSFDCSGYVSWVYNQCGWDFGRLGAQGLYNISTRVRTPPSREIWCSSPGHTIPLTFLMWAFMWVTAGCSIAEIPLDMQTCRQAIGSHISTPTGDYLKRRKQWQ